MTAPYVSIIMPAYNASATIGAAIEAIRAQSFEDWELIVVNDASTDDTEQIAQAHAAQDARIRVITLSKNGGPAGARNAGLDTANGTYVWIPDSDDAYEESLLDRACAETQKGSIDVVVFGCTEIYQDENGEFLYQNDIVLPTEQFESSEQWHRRILDLEQRTLYGYPWNKLYRRALVDQDRALRFDSILLIEDLLFNVEFFDRVRSVAFMGGAPYRYTKRRDVSLTNANAYSALDYYEVHRHRILALRDQLDSWGVLDDHAKARLGSLLGRYVLSALERSYAPTENWTRKQRRAWIQAMADDPLYQELIPYAQARGSKALDLSLTCLRTQNAELACMLGRGINISRRHLYPLFTKLRSKR